MTTVRLGPVTLEDGVSRTNGWALLYAAFVTIGLVTGMAVLTPYLLTETLGLDEGRQGRALGTLTIVNEVVLILAYGPLGALSDRFGRRILYVAGFLAMATAYLLFPLAGSFLEFSAVRVIYALGIGAATGMYGTLLADYAVERDRGKLAAIGGILNGLGVVLLALVLGALPAWFVGRGLSGPDAAMATGVIGAVACAATAVVLWLGLKPGAPAATERLPLATMLKRGVEAARASPDIAVGYAAAFVARGDLAIVGIFTVAWGKQAALAQGLSPSDALEAGRLPFIIAQSAALLWPLAIIAFIDRLPRALMLAAAMGIGAIGYLGMGLVSDPLAAAAIPFFAALGIGQISAVLGAQTLIGKAAPPESRGAVIGLFNFSGAVGILVLGAVAGWAFDALGPAAPFVIVGALNALVALAAYAVHRQGRPARA
ncbi:MAG: MFS transporter [Sphingomonadaceae bacterium]